ncbi:MAG: sugar ABC transporter substrate-binding protein [Gammaproteobacteria bacterium]|nr:MAG: sugar ABC transporter substrate-binding protein [Gammaproteobacteria bacterium]
MQIQQLVVAAAVTAATSTAALADEVEVLHWWTAGGEAAAVSVLKENLESQGTSWVDMAVSGGAGDAAMTTLRARVTAGDPPTAAQMLGMSVREWADEGFLGNLDEVAEAEGWDDVIPPAVQAFGKHDGHWVAAPVNIHRPHWIWASAKIFDELDLSMPQTWDEFFDAADKIQEAGYTAIAMGGQPWQETTTWEAIVLSISPTLYKNAIIEADDEALRSEGIVKSFEILRRIRGYVDDNFAGRDWNLATAMVIKGEAGMQIMGDWAKGEVINADLTPGEEILCDVVPGTQGAFLFNTDYFAMFDVGDDRQAAQRKMASAAMSGEFQETFNLAKGSIPARTDVPGDKFDVCARKSMSDLAEATEAGTLFGSLAHGHGQPAAVQAAYFDVITQFFNGDMSPEDAASALADSVAAAL